MKNCCRQCCCAIFCCTCCRKTPLNVINEETRLLPKNNATRNELEIDELYVFGSAPQELRRVLLEGYRPQNQKPPINKIVCGKSHCIILLNNNSLIGFGSNEEGQLGLTLETKDCCQITQLPINIPNISLENSTIIDIAAGDEFSLILIKTQEDHTIIVRFGTDILNKYANIPNTVCQKVEKLPELSSNINKIIAFEKRKIFCTEENEIYVGGRDFSGTEIDEYILLKKFDNTIETIFLQKESCIVQDKNNTIFGLGDNSYKELGIGFNFSMNDFKKLGFKFSKSPIKKISSGARHLLFLLNNGEVYCVGDNSEGQCCGATSNCAFPVKLELNSKKRIVDCYAGYNHNLIILENGSVYTWGNTANGKLGYYEDKFTQDTPKEILGMKIKCINNVCLGYQLTVIATGKEEDSLIIKNMPPKVQNINELN